MIEPEHAARPAWHKRAFADVSPVLVLGLPVVGWIAGLVTLIAHSDLSGAILWRRGSSGPSL
ncbi:hypothetical protein [Streptomyces sp. NPDC057740]|uniref:hypothetical protein n=1 Tax=Streptomyces sp. NPDC057740 TaxID=3346234 RepID=UPI0036855FF0